jgi:hypothetical protein
MGKSVSKSAFARIKGISPARVSQLIKGEIISRESDGRLDLRKAGGQLKAYRKKRSKMVWCSDLGIFLDFSGY